MTDLNLKPAQVLSIERENPGVQFVRVRVDEREEKAVNYLDLGNEVQPGQDVLVNTTAVDLNLGSGGCHFILPACAKMNQGWGHQMKLRYTPLQLRVNCAEEQDSPWHKRFLKPGGLRGIPVLAAELHSMLPPLALAIKTLDPSARISYLVTEGGALPAPFSNNISALKDMGALTHTITSGNSFGGDLETINVFTGLQAAARIAKASYIIAALGPGIAGTGTIFGFSGLEMGFVLQAAWALGGKPVMVPRIGFQDSRPRHRGISHHSITVLSKAYAGPVWIPLPLLHQPRRKVLLEQVQALPRRCHVYWRDGSFIAKLAQEHPGLFSSMGRGFADNPEFFIALGAAARLAVARNRLTK